MRNQQSDEVLAKIIRTGDLSKAERQSDAALQKRALEIAKLPPDQQVTELIKFIHGNPGENFNRTNTPRKGK